MPQNRLSLNFFFTKLDFRLIIVMFCLETKMTCDITLQRNKWYKVLQKIFGKIVFGICLKQKDVFRCSMD